MRAPKWFTFAIAFFAAVETGHAQVEAQQPKAVLTVEYEAIASAKSRDGIKMIISAPGAPTAGSPIPIQVILRNEGTSSVSAWFPRYGGESAGFAVATRNGEMAPLTRFGSKHFQPELSEFLRTSSATVNDVSPEGSCRLTVPNVALYYDLTVAGEYSLTVTMRIRSKEGHGASVEELTAGPLRIAVRNPVLMESTRK